MGFLIGVIMFFFMFNMIRALAKIGQKEVDKTGVDKMSDKSIKMKKEGPVCPPHNWGYMEVKDEFGRSNHVHFCDICKKTPAMLAVEHSRGI